MEYFTNNLTGFPEEADEMFDYGWGLREDLRLPDNYLLLPHLRDYEALLRHTNRIQEADAVMQRIAAH